MASFAPLKSKIFNREERKQQYQDHIRGLNAYDRHKKFLNDYVAFYGKEKSRHVTLPVKTDQDTLREGYRFIRSEEDDKDSTWEQRLVKRYYDKLFKEYCIADMSHYKSGKIGLRWRTEKEVISGKGQFICGNKHCDEKDGLASYEVNFAYVEAGESKQALVKLVACDRCAEKLHYKRWKENEQLERREKELYRKKRDQSRSEHDTDEEYEESKEKRSSEPTEKEKHRRKSHLSGIDHGVMMIEMRSMRGETLRQEEENKSTKGKGMKLAVAMDQMMCMAKVKRKQKEKRFLVQPMIMMLITATTLMNFSRACSSDSSRMTLPCPLNPGGKLNSSSISMLQDYPVEIVEILLLPATSQQ